MEWIQARLEKPCDDKWVLAVVNGNVDMAKYEDGKWCDYPYGFPLKGKKKVTHWMPRPEPPTE